MTTALEVGEVVFTPGKDPVLIVQEAGRAPGPVWTGTGNLASTGIRSPDRPTRSQSLYRLRYQAHWSLSNFGFYSIELFGLPISHLV